MVQRTRPSLRVVPGLGPGTHDFRTAPAKPWMAGPSNCVHEAQTVLSLSMAFMVTIIFRMTALMATLGSFP